MRVSSIYDEQLVTIEEAKEKIRLEFRTNKKRFFEVF